MFQSIIITPINSTNHGVGFAVKEQLKWHLNLRFHLKGVMVGIADKKRFHTVSATGMNPVSTIHGCSGDGMRLCGLNADMAKSGAKG